MEGSHPHITVLMSVYNGERYLGTAIDSILNQTYTDFEFLIVDDASTDSTPLILHSYDDPRITIITNTTNIGLTRSLNKGLKQARGEYIARMDADDISLPERFMKQVQFLKAHPDVAVVGTSHQIIDDKGTLFRSFTHPSRPRFQDFIKYDNFLTHGSVMIRTSILVKFSGYNELFKRCQDYSLWMQMSRDYTLCNLPEVLYQLRDHGKKISYQGDDSILYHFLAVWDAKSIVPENLVDEINQEGIECIKKYLTPDERIIYHSRIAGRYFSKGQLDLARREYWKIFQIQPLNLRNLANLIRVSLGKKVLDASIRLHEILKNMSNNLR